MTRPIKIVANCETGEVQEIELTDEEIEQLEADRAVFAAEQAAREEAEAAKAAAKASALEKLAALGLTEEEASAIIS